MIFASASSPKWANASQTAIDLTVVFPSLGDDPVPFTASPDDVTDHGRELYARALAGDFGPIADADPPPAPVVNIPVISDRQFIHRLRQLGLVTQAEALDFVRTGSIPAVLAAVIETIPAGEARDDAELLLSGAVEFHRHRPLVEMFAAAQNPPWTAEQVDQFFIDAAAL